MPKPSRSKTQKRASLTTQYNNSVDRSKPLADTTVGCPQDRFELKPMSSIPPTRVPRNFTRRSYWYKGSVDLAQITTSLAVPVGGTYTFTLSQLNLTALQAVFDQYAIVEVVLRITPQQNFNSAAATRPGVLVSVIDHDDSTGLTTLAQAQEYASALTTNGLVGHTRVIQPRIASAVYSGAFTSFANTRSYIDCASTGVVHYGVKTYASVSVGQAYVYNVDADYIVHFRDSH